MALISSVRSLPGGGSQRIRRSQPGRLARWPAGLLLLALYCGPLAAGAQHSLGLMHASAQGGGKDDAQAVA